MRRINADNPCKSVASVFLPLKIALINGAADLHLPGVLCAGVVITALALTLLALLNLVFLFSQETYYAALPAFVMFTLVALPASIFMYRSSKTGRVTLQLDKKSCQAA